jgi:1-acyl-sn-glycerol-3-phosphate acyltransferase
MNAIRSLLYLLLLIITVIPYAIATLLWRPLPRQLRWKLTMGWPRMAIWLARWICGIRWEIQGWENLPREGGAIVLAKHQSAWETMFLAAWLPRELCFVYKRELNWLPFFGWGLAALDMIAIDRSKGSDAFEQVVSLGSQRLAEGRWLIMFPEGTRTPPGHVGRYKTGGARVAVRTGMPIIPIAHNAGECWPRNALVKTPGTIRVVIGKPISTDGKSAETVGQEVYDWIEGTMRRLNPERYLGV